MKKEEFKFRDEVWLMVENKATQLQIFTVVSTIYETERGEVRNKRDLYVRDANHQMSMAVDECKLFHTKEELLNSL